VDPADPPDKAAAISSVRRALRGSSPVDHVPSIPRVQLRAAVSQAPEAPELRADAQASASVPASAAHRAQADSAHHVQADSAAALVAPLHLPASHRAHNAPALPRAVADVSSIPRPKKAR
jgi:hypothetical protein